MPNKVWILFSCANDYNQPDKAFEELFWHKPSSEQLLKYDIKTTLNTGDNYEDRETRIEYWIETFKKGK